MSARRAISGPYRDERIGTHGRWVVTAKLGDAVSNYTGRSPEEACRLAGVRPRPAKTTNGKD